MSKTQQIIRSIRKTLRPLKSFYRTILWNIFQHVFQIRAQKIRRKDNIKVLFLVSELATWKTEMLYLAMLKTKRIQPILGVTNLQSGTDEENARKKVELLNYFANRNYDYVEIKDRKTMKNQVQPDIIFYQEPYPSYINYDLFPTKNMYALFCYVHYGYNTMDKEFEYNMVLHNICWQYYFENELALVSAKKFMLIKGKNVVITGLPPTDELLLPKVTGEDPWKKQENQKKRIIWAPHHSIGTKREEIITFSCFLEIADDMLKIAEKYKNQVQFAFKPHPLLRGKLIKHWSKDKIDKYYEMWATMENTQLEQGKYDQLFKYSDAMIHDSASFTVEYLYMHKPCMYTVNGKEHKLNEFGQQAYDLYYKGSSAKEIEEFIQGVIDGKDPRKEERERFYNNYLLPPHNQTACENIISAILGIPPYNS